MSENDFLKTFLDGVSRQLGDYRREIGELSEQAGVSPIAMAGAKKVYDSLFGRHERPDYSTVAGVYCRQRMGDANCKELWIPHGEVRLRGYFYPAAKSRGTVVLAHGLHAGADDYIPLILKLVERGYDVLSYDGTGTYDSEGDSTVGLSQGLVDLDRVLGFVKSENFKKPLFTVGHSCGGYAATAVLALHDGISACAAIAPPNNCFTLILDKGRQYAGELAASGLTADILDFYQRKLFGSYADRTGVDGINSANIPVLIAHGLNDKVISLGKQSVIAHKHLIKNDRVTYYLGTGLSDGHDSVWHSFRAAEYKMEIDERVKKLKKDQKAAFYQKVDHALYSEVNEELFEQIMAVFQSA